MVWPKHDSDASNSDMSESESDSEPIIMQPAHPVYDLHEFDWIWGAASSQVIFPPPYDPDTASTICYGDLSDPVISENDIFDVETASTVSFSEGSSHGTVADFLQQATCRICNDEPPFSIVNDLEMGYVESGSCYAMNDEVPFIRCCQCESWHHLVCVQMSAHLPDDEISTMIANALNGVEFTCSTCQEVHV
jgi:hypothetical protein